MLRRCVGRLRALMSAATKQWRGTRQRIRLFHRGCRPETRISEATLGN
jgi:hypothetical protein